MKTRFLPFIVAVAVGLLLAHLPLQAQTHAEPVSPSQNRFVLVAGATSDFQRAQKDSATMSAGKKNGGKIAVGILGIGLMGLGAYMGLDATSTELRSEVSSQTCNPITGICTPNFRLVEETKTDTAKLYRGVGVGLVGAALASYGFSK